MTDASMTRSKPDQVLNMDPKHELHFKGPYTEVVTSYLRLTNPSERRVCFKVKTTAPKRYCVRPNNGIIEPKGNASIAVMLQPFDIENQSDKNKHKFMVQTMFAPEGDGINQDNLWKEVNPDMIMDSKLKCVFDSPTGQVPTIQESPATAPNSSPANVSISKGMESSSSFMTDTTSNYTVTSGDDLAKKQSEENRRLKEEIVGLRQEIMKAREDGLKQRNKATPGSAMTPSSPADLIAQQQGGKSGDPDLSQLITNPQILAMLVVLFFLGLILGKILF